MIPLLITFSTSVSSRGGAAMRRIKYQTVDLNSEITVWEMNSSYKKKKECATSVLSLSFGCGAYGCVLALCMHGTCK